MLLLLRSILLPAYFMELLSPTRDLQSYLSDLSLFVAHESNKLYILVDNRPWLRDLGSRPAHLWQLMVTKSRLSPFANSKARREKKEGKEACSPSNVGKRKKFERWFRLIDAVTLSRKRVLLPVKKLHNSSLLSRELHRTLYGFIVFEVAWNNVRGINYLNELQTDTSLAIEAKFMHRWEFDCIAQAASCMSSWFPGTVSEKLLLKEYLHSAVGEVFYDAEEDILETLSDDDAEKFYNDNLSVEDDSLMCVSSNFSISSRSDVDKNEVQLTPPPPTGPYKRRKVTNLITTRMEAGVFSDGIGNSEIDPSNCENPEATQYRDVLILFRFNDHDLPFTLGKIIMSDLRLLTLLEAGLPSWVIFLQSYPVFSHVYRPWMCPLARALYVLISIVTVLIGFYDLYKNVPVLKATASRLFGPLFDWIETWEMISRIKYLGTMLFLHNFQKAVKWFLTIRSTTRSFLSVLTQPLAEPLVDFFEFLLPVSNVLIEVVERSFSAFWILIESSCSLVGNLAEMFLFPIWFVVSIIWSIATSVLCPIFWILWELLYAPIRMVFALANLIAFVCTSINEMLGEIWEFISSIIRVASASEATVSTYEVSMWRSLWNDLFSQVFRALKSILNGFVAFFTACNRHRLSIYNHLLEFIRRLFGRPQRLRQEDSRSSRTKRETPQHMSEARRKLRIN
ncbi:G1/S-specific cyclin-E protein [Parasponia andersonii]|uniref:G1/S-specific cyclin-E protein n=1 Tax=Parasponia andersonii TaxID=3476 RepID=A0A2P5AYL2_PARAD|nr:G1/S-specific cyclin-E protein [Parasponia andersonii]